MNSQTLFLTYANADSKYAARLASDLSDKGFQIVAEREAAPGQNWEKQLRRSLDSADAVLLLLSSEGEHSNWVMFELGAAMAKRKKIIPILIENGSWRHAPEWKSLRFIDATKINKGRLIHQIESALAN